MKNSWLDREILLLGAERVQRLGEAHVLCVGLGGVGGLAAELVVRAGIGELTIVDGDVFEESNINRQIFALSDTAGRKKADAASERLMRINPELRLHAVDSFLSGDSIETLLDAARYSCVIDAIDTLQPKVALLAGCVRRGIPVVSSMGSGARLDLSRITAADISKTFNCPLAKAVRCALREQGVRHGVTAVFSSELPIRSAVLDTGTMEHHKRSTLGTISFVPSAFACRCAAEAIAMIP